MKIKKFILSLAVMSSITVSVTAENILEIKPVDLTDNSITIEGELDKKQAQNVMIIVTRPEVDFSAIESSEDIFKYQWEKQSDSNGYFDLKFTMDSEDASGYYGVYVKSKYTDNPIYKAFYFTGDDGVKSCIKEINEKNEAYLAEHMTEYIKALGLEDFEPAKVCDNAVIAKKLKQNSPYEPDEGVYVQSIVRDNAILDCYKTGKKEYILNEKYQLKYQDVIGYDTFDEDYSSTLYKVYNSILNNTGKEKVINNLCGRDFGTYDDLKKEFAKSVLIYGIKNTDNMGTEHISEIITQNNAKLVGLLVNEYFASDMKNKINSRIVQLNEIKDVKDLENKIKKIIDDLKEPNSTHSGSQVNGGGSKSDSFTGISASTAAETQKNNAIADIFSDVSSGFWAREAIENLYNKKIIDGYGDNTFRPSNKITREAAVKILCEAFDAEEADNECSFTDVSSDQWYYGYILRGVKSGFINGVSEYSFGIGQEVTREDFAVMFYRVIGNNEQFDSANFSDDYDISPYARQAVAYMREKSLINGYADNTFRPKNGITRAEAATIIYNYLREELR